MLSIITNMNTYFNPFTSKTDNTNISTVNETSVPLTDEELSLAEEFKEFLGYASVANNAAKKILSDEDYDKNELLDAVKSYKENKHRFENVRNAIGLQQFDSKNLFAEMDKRSSFGLPRQNYHFNIATNSVTLGEGSKIPLGDSYLYVYDNVVGAYPSDYKPNPEDDGFKILMDISSGDVSALRELIYGVKSGNANWGNNLEVNRSILSLLKKMGIDTSKDFNINGITFEVKEGIVQTKGYSEKEERQYGYSYLYNLLDRANEQSTKLNPYS